MCIHVGDVSVYPFSRHSLPPSLHHASCIAPTCPAWDGAAVAAADAVTSFASEHAAPGLLYHSSSPCGPSRHTGYHSGPSRDALPSAAGGPASWDVRNVAPSTSVLWLEGCVANDTHGSTFGF